MGTERTDRMLGYDDLLEAASPADLDAITPQLNARDPINIQFTSGTTGNPKGRHPYHHNVVNNGRFVAMAMSWARPTDYVFRFRFITVSAWCFPYWPAFRSAPAWFSGEAFDPSPLCAQCPSVAGASRGADDVHRPA
jgi:acyl-coenzyme A synthetase/AMP-(fatty) acid ligase